MDNEMLQAISQMMDEKLAAQRDDIRNEIHQVVNQAVAASEKRMMAAIAEVKASTAEQIAASESRMKASTAEQIAEVKASTAEQIAEVKAFTVEQIAASENRMKAYFENDLRKAVDVIAEGHKMLAEKIDRIDLRKEMDEMKGAFVVVQSDIMKLQKAQG